MVSRRAFNALLAAGAVVTLAPDLVRAQSVTQAKNVVLVHGLYADGSSWLEVIPRLQSAGLKVTGVQNPLMSIAEDAAATRRVLALQDGPTVLVGHSFAGTIISEAGTDPGVSALVSWLLAHPMRAKTSAHLRLSFPNHPLAMGW